MTETKPNQDQPLPTQGDNDANSYQPGGSHYRHNAGDVEHPQQHWDRMVQLFGWPGARPYFVGNMTAYLERYWLKGNIDGDLAKVEHYAKKLRELEAKYGPQEVRPVSDPPTADRIKKEFLNENFVPRVSQPPLPKREVHLGLNGCMLCETWKPKDAASSGEVVSVCRCGFRGVVPPVEFDGSIRPVVIETPGAYRIHKYSMWTQGKKVSDPCFVRGCERCRSWGPSLSTEVEYVWQCKECQRRGAMNTSVAVEVVNALSSNAQRDMNDPTT